MKNALFAILTVLCFSGCYRDRPLPDHRSMLSKHKWYMATKAYNFGPIDRNCVVSQEMVMNKDCTGSFSNPGSCDSTLPGNMAFDWFLASDNHLIHIRKLGQHTDIALLKIVTIYDDELTLQGTFGGQNFYAVYKDVKQEEL